MLTITTASLSSPRSGTLHLDGEWKQKGGDSDYRKSKFLEEVVSNLKFSIWWYSQSLIRKLRSSLMFLRRLRRPDATAAMKKSLEIHRLAHESEFDQLLAWSLRAKSPYALSCSPVTWGNHISCLVWAIVKIKRANLRKVLSTLLPTYYTLNK